MSDGALKERCVPGGGSVAGRARLVSMAISSLLAALLGAVALLEGSWAAAGAAWTVNAAVAIWVLTWSVLHNRSDAQAGQPPRHIGATVVAALTIACISIPAVSLVWRSRVATVERLAERELATSAKLSVALWVATVCLIAFSLGESLLSSRRRELLPEQVRTRDETWRLACPLMYVVGISAYILSRGDDRTAAFLARGSAQGEGLVSSAKWALPIGITVALLYGHWGSRSRAIASVIGVLIIVDSGVRSPLILIAIAAIPRLVDSIGRARRPVLAVTAALVLGWLLVSVGSGINVWRGGIRHGEPVTLTSAIVAASQDPVKGLTEAGIDTIDGLLFTQALPNGLQTDGLWDLRKAVTTIIPRQLYPNKPDLLSNALSREYLGFGTAGMFLSGAGYLRIIGGGWWAAGMGFVVLGALYQAVSRAGVRRVRWVIATYVLVRFYMGGDAYDFFQGLQLSLVASAAYLVSSLIAPMIRTRRGRAELSHA